MPHAPIGRLPHRKWTVGGLLRAVLQTGDVGLRDAWYDILSTICPTVVVEDTTTLFPVDGHFIRIPLRVIEGLLLSTRMPEVLSICVPPAVITYRGRWIVEALNAAITMTVRVHHPIPCTQVPSVACGTWPVEQHRRGIHGLDHE